MCVSAMKNKVFEYPKCSKSAAYCCTFPVGCCTSKCSKSTKCSTKCSTVNYLNIHAKTTIAADCCISFPVSLIYLK